jgi:hypothetical protein
VNESELQIQAIGNSSSTDNPALATELTQGIRIHRV